MLDRILEINKLGLIFMVLSAIMVYGAKFIVQKIFKFPIEESMKPLIILKLVGLFVGIIGMLKIIGIV